MSISPKSRVNLLKGIVHTIRNDCSDQVRRQAIHIVGSWMENLQQTFPDEYRSWAKIAVSLFLNRVVNAESMTELAALNLLLDRLIDPSNVGFFVDDNVLRGFSSKIFTVESVEMHQVLVEFLNRLIEILPTEYVAQHLNDLMEMVIHLFLLYPVPPRRRSDKIFVEKLQQLSAQLSLRFDIASVLRDLLCDTRRILAVRQDALEKLLHQFLDKDLVNRLLHIFGSPGDLLRETVGQALQRPEVFTVLESVEGVDETLKKILYEEDLPINSPIKRMGGAILLKKYPTHDRHPQWLNQWLSEKYIPSIENLEYRRNTFQRFLPNLQDRFKHIAQTKKPHGEYLTKKQSQRYLKWKKKYDKSRKTTAVSSGIPSQRQEDSDSMRDSLKNLVDTILLSTGVRLADPVSLTIPHRPIIVHATPIGGESKERPLYFVMDSQLIPSYQPWRADAGGVVIRHQRGSRAQEVFTVSVAEERDLPEEWKTVPDILREREKIFREIDQIDPRQLDRNRDHFSELYGAIGESLADAVLVHLQGMNDFLDKQKRGQGGQGGSQSKNQIRSIPRQIFTTLTREGQDERMTQTRHRIIRQWLPYLEGIVDDVIQSGTSERTVFLIDSMNVLRGLYRQLRQKRYRTTPPAQMNQAIDRYIQMLRGRSTDPHFRRAPKIYVAVRLLSPTGSSSGERSENSYTLTVAKVSEQQTVLHLPVRRHPPPAILLDRCMDDLVLMTLASLFRQKEWRPIIISDDQYRDWDFEGQRMHVEDVYPYRRSQGGGEAASR